MSNTEIVERVCHFNGNFRRITIVKGHWFGPRGSIVLPEQARDPILWIMDGKPRRIDYYVHGKLRRQYLFGWCGPYKQPIMFHYYENGHLCTETTQVIGSKKLKPAVKYHPGIPNVVYSWFVNGRRHTIDPHAEILYHESGHPIQQTWRSNGNNHRTDGQPANIVYYENGQPSEESWFVNGQLHRTDGPAKTIYNFGRHVSEESWFIVGQRHRTDGPSKIMYNMRGQVIRAVK